MPTKFRWFFYEFSPILGAMDLLEKRITGDWIEIREKLNTPQRMKAYLKLEEFKLSTLPGDLRSSTMGGIVEFKKRLGGSVFNFLTKLGYTTPNQNEILGAEADIRVLLYILCLQTQFVTGQVKPSKDAEGPLAGSNPRNRPPVEEVVAEVRARMAGNPDLAKNPHVKNIFMEIQLYQKEFSQFSALSPQIPDDRAPTFFANYKKRLDGILDNVHSHFRDIRLAEDDEMRREFQKQEEDVFVLPELVKSVSAQAQALAKVRSSIFHALQEGYQIRNLLLKLVEGKEPYMLMLDEELRLLDSRQEPGVSGHPAAVKFARAVAVVLEGNKKS
jgi:hypothetical protein